MNKVRYKWKVADAPSGPFRSFQRRGWPSASYLDAKDSPAAMIGCADDYIPRNAREGKHAPLRVFIADHTQTPWQWRKLKGEFPTLDAAKAAFTRFIEANPQVAPRS